MESLLLYVIRKQIKYLIAANLHIASVVTLLSKEKEKLHFGCEYKDYWSFYKFILLRIISDTRIVP